MTSTLLPSFPAVDDVLFNFAQSDGLSQANRVDSVRNQRLTATVVFLDGIEQISAFLPQNPQITTIHLYY